MYKISCTLHVFFKQIFLKKIASKNLSVVSTSFAEKTPGQNWGGGGGGRTHYSAWGCCHVRDQKKIWAIIDGSFFKSTHF